jgi:hypothetical protein
MQFLIYLVIAFGDRCGYEEFNFSMRMIDHEFAHEISASVYTQSHDLKVQVSYYLDLMFQEFQIISSLRTYRIGDDKYDLMRFYLFEQNTNHTQFDNFSQNVQSFTFSDGLVHSMILTRNLFDLNISKKPNQFIQCGNEIWNPGMSAEPLSTHLTDGENIFLSFIYGFLNSIILYLY